ncbi:MacB-like periplasmic core domain protein [uncultured archaeon]|nr:MacB-like periplasmic core domain protein [uncultured archaeon]
MFDLIIRSLTQRKMRTGLTIFGIALGIFAVVVMGGMSEHSNLTFDRSMKLTAEMIRVMPDTSLGGSLDDSKVKEVRRVPGVSDAYGLLMMPLDQENLAMGFGGDMVVGIAPEKQRVALKDTKLTDGRLLVEGDGNRAVIGSSIAREFKLKVGDELEVKSKRLQRATSITHVRNFTVVGILEYTGSFYDSMVTIPLDTAQKFYEQEKKVSVVLAYAEQDADPEDLSKRIELSVDNVKTISPGELRKQVEGQLVIFSLITVSAAVLAALIGGLSVMNTMLMSVSERTKEFGILKALGAERKDILFMTMGEAALMGIIGGIFGIAIGGTLVYYLNDILASKGTALFDITPRLVVVALLFATILGMVCGTYPAYRATRMSPMEALRYE